MLLCQHQACMSHSEALRKVRVDAIIRRGRGCARAPRDLSIWVALFDWRIGACRIVCRARRDVLHLTRRRVLAYVQVPAIGRGFRQRAVLDIIGACCRAWCRRSRTAARATPSRWYTHTPHTTPTRHAPTSARSAGPWSARLGMCCAAPCRLRAHVVVACAVCFGAVMAHYVGLADETCEATRAISIARAAGLAYPMTGTTYRMNTCVTFLFRLRFQADPRVARG